MPEACTECYCLVGPTATGKSAVAHFLAEAGGHEIVSADSMQVYAGMDIGTAKPTAEERSRVRYHMLDVVEPDRPYSAGAYRQDAGAAMAEARRRGREAIVTGGTGLYVKALTEGLHPQAPVDLDRRARWESLYRQEGVPGLQQALRQRAPAIWAALADRRNPRRLIRALERAQTEADAPPATWRVPSSAPALVGVTRSVRELNRRIETRVDGMYRQGLLEESRQLAARFPVFSRTARHAIGYAEALACLAGRLTVAQAKERTAARTRQLAKRQRTWFRTQMNVVWVTLDAEMQVDEAAGAVARAWARLGRTPVAPA